MLRIQYLSFLVVILAVSIVSSCGGSSHVRMDGELTVTPIEGSTLKGVEFTSSADEVRIKLTSVPESGVYLRVALPAGQGVISESWTNDAETLHLSVNTTGGFDFGIVPVKGYKGGPVSANLLLGECAYKAVTKAPDGARNQLVDLDTHYRDNGGAIELTWTEVNRGDYDHNREVSISDISPLGKNLNSKYSENFGKPYAELSEAEKVLYWVDGDQNGEVNINDLTPIGENYKSFMSGYNIYLIDRVDPQDITTVTVARESAVLDPNNERPARYTQLIPVSPGDSFEIAPRGDDNEVGTGAKVSMQPEVQFGLSLNVVGLDLFDLEGTGSGPYSPDRVKVFVDSIKRRIAPGDYPYSDAHGAAIDLDDDGEYEVWGVATDGASMVCIDYAPKNDLETGVVLGSPQWERIVIPIHLGREQKDLTSMDVEVHFVEKVEDGYYVDVTTDFTTESGTTRRVIRMDFGASLVFSDVDQDDAAGEEFDDEAQLECEDRNCVSSRMLEFLADRDEYGTIREARVTGDFSEWSLSTGDVTIDLASIDFQQGDGPQALGDGIVLFLNERVILTKGFTPGGFDLIPAGSDPLPGDNMAFRVEVLTDPDGILPDKYWIDELMLE